MGTSYFLNSKITTSTIPILSATLSALGSMAASRPIFMGTAGRSSAPMVCTGASSCWNSFGLCGLPRLRKMSCAIALRKHYALAVFLYVLYIMLRRADIWCVYLWSPRAGILFCGILSPINPHAIGNNQIDWPLSTASWSASSTMAPLPNGRL